MIESINTVARLWWAWSAAMFWQVGLLIVLIACIDRLIRRWAWPHLRYALWSLVLIKLILPPTLSLPSGALPKLRPVVGQAVQWMDSETPVAEESPVLESLYEHSIVAKAMEPTPHIPVAFAAIRSDEVVIETDPAGQAPAFQRRHRQPVRQAQGNASLEAAAPLRTNPRLSWQVYAMATWFAGTLILGIWLFLRLHSLAGPQGNRVVSTDGTTLPQSFYSQMAGCAERLGLRRLPRVIVVRRLATPAVFGVFRPVLLMPQGYLSRLSRRDTEHMLLHELAHIRRGDLRTHGLYMLLQVVYWYNPLLWLVRRQLHHLRELSCDATVAELLRERTKAYRQTLLETARRFLATSTELGLGLLGLFEDANRLATRLNWLARPTWRYKTMKRTFVCIVAAAMFACVLPMAQGQDRAPAVVEHQPTHHTQDQAPNTQQLEELQARLKELEIERMKLQKELQALARAQQKAREAQVQSIEAAKEAEKAKEGAIEAHVKAKEAQAHAVEAHANIQDHQQWAEEMQAWSEQMQQWQQGPEMQAWQESLERWENSEEFQKWQEDVEKWSTEYSHRIEKAYGGDAGTDGVVAIPPMPPMPAMPAMPAPPAHPAPHPMPHPVPQVHMPVMPEIHMPDMPQVNAPVQHDDGKIKATETMSFTSPLVDGGLLIVKNRVGAVNIRGSETNEWRVDVRVVARAETEEEARAMVEAVKMKMDTSERRFSIEPVKADNEDWSGLDVTFEITVPRQTNLDITADVGAVQLRDVRGQIKVKANVGGIKTDNVRGDLNLETNVGDIDFIAPDDLSARLTATTSIGGIKTDLPVQVHSAGNPRPGGTNMSLGNTAAGTLGDGEGTVNLKSNVGSISLRSKASAPKSSQGRRTVTLQTRDGSTQVDHR